MGGGRVGETCGAVNLLDLIKQLSPDMREKRVERGARERGGRILVRPTHQTLMFLPLTSTLHLTGLNPISHLTTSIILFFPFLSPFGDHINFWFLLARPRA